MKSIHNSIVLLAIVVAGLTTAYAQDPLSTWNDGEAKQAIVDFVKATTETGGPEAGTLNLPTCETAAPIFVEFHRPASSAGVRPLQLKPNNKQQTEKPKYETKPTH